MRILGYNISHDSSICSIKDGNIEFFAKEERLSRVKRDANPLLCLNLYSSLNLGSIDHIVSASPSRENKAEFAGELVYFELFRKLFSNQTPILSSVPHHLAHAHLAFINSKFEEALVFVIDRNGSIVLLNDLEIARESESVYCFNKNIGYKPIHKNYWSIPGSKYSKETINSYLQSQFPHAHVRCENPYGIVKVYEAATTLMDLDPMENGKTMGLSAYGSESSVQLFVDGASIDNYFDHHNGNCIFNNHQKFIEKNITKENYKFYANKAKLVQNATQSEVLSLIDFYTRQTGIKNVCLVGGYALNVVANYFYIQNLPEIDFYFEPIADDTGVSIGAAMHKYKEITGNWCEPTENTFFHYHNESSIGIGEQASIDEVCDLLINQKSVAIFEGSAEVGPRALGHRSILFDARNLNAKEIVNKIKNREWYRPFAGVILESEFENYFKTLGIKKSPNMTISFECKRKTQQLVPGIIHVDDTCRVQTVSDGFLYDLLRAFHKKTNCPMLLNTSLNLAGEPLVQTKADAIKTFENSKLDALFFVDEGKILTKS